MYEELQNFGLSKNEIEIYVSLIKAGVSTANRVSKITGIKRSTTYDNLSLLINKGLVSSVTKNDVTYFEAANPQKIIRLLEEKINKIKKIIPGLQSLKETAKEKSGVTFFEGKKGVITVLSDILEENKDLCFYGSRKMAMKALTNYPDDFITKRVEYKIKLKAVFAYEDKKDAVFKNKKVKNLSETRYLENFDKISSNVFIYSDRVAFITSGENLVGVIIKNKEIVDQQRRIFELLWKISNK